MRQIREEIGTRSQGPAGSTCEQCGGASRCPRAGRPYGVPGYKIEDVVGYDALWDAMERCKRGVMWKSSVASFVLNAPERIAKLSEQLGDGTYEPRPATHFTVTSPKRREIVGIAFRDRVYQRSLNDNVVYPVMSRSWIRDNYACQEGKGTDDGRRRFKCFLQRHSREHGTDGYVLSLDVKGYYPNMRHDLVEDMFREKLPCWAYLMVEEVLRGQYPGEVGYNPGSQVIQIAGISLLSRIDHLVKEVMRVRHYGRYMDDFKLVHRDGGYLAFCRDLIGDELASMGFELNAEKTAIRPVTETTPFLGFDFRLARSGDVVMTVRPESVKRMRRRVSRLMALEARGLRPPGTAEESFRDSMEHYSKGDSRLLLERCEGWFDGLRRRYA